METTTVDAPVTSEPKTVKLSDLIESCDPRHLEPYALKHEENNTVCALGLAWEHGSGSWDDIDFDYSSTSISSTHKFFKTLYKDWGLDLPTAILVQIIFDRTVGDTYKTLMGDEPYVIGLPERIEETSEEVYNQAVKVAQERVATKLRELGL